MVGNAIVVGVHPIWNTITSHPFPAVEAVKRQTFNYCACPVTGVNRTAAPVKYTIEQSEPIAVMGARQNNLQRPLDNVQVPLKKVRGVKIKQPILVVVATFTKIQQARTK
jgi:hypothetical protein